MKWLQWKTSLLWVIFIINHNFTNRLKYPGKLANFLKNTLQIPPFFSEAFKISLLIEIKKNWAHGSHIRWLLRTCCACMKKNSLFWEKKIRFGPTLDLINTLNRSNDGYRSLRVAPFLSYHLINDHHGLKQTTLIFYLP